MGLRRGLATWGLGRLERLMKWVNWWVGDVELWWADDIEDELGRRW